MNAYETEIQFEYASKLDELARKTKTPQTQLAKMIGIPRSTLLRFLYNRGFSSTKTFEKIKNFVDKNKPEKFYIALKLHHSCQITSFLGTEIVQLSLEKGSNCVALVFDEYEDALRHVDWDKKKVIECEKDIKLCPNQ